MTINALELHALLGELNPSFKKLCPFAIAVCLHPTMLSKRQKLQIKSPKA
jgi:hypothetical protein